MIIYAVVVVPSIFLLVEVVNLVSHKILARISKFLLGAFEARHLHAKLFQLCLFLLRVLLGALLVLLILLGKHLFSTCCKFVLCKRSRHLSRQLHKICFHDFFLVNISSAHVVSLSFARGADTSVGNSIRSAFMTSSTAFPSASTQPGFFMMQRSTSIFFPIIFLISSTARHFLENLFLHFLPLQVFFFLLVTSIVSVPSTSMQLFIASASFTPIAVPAVHAKATSPSSK